jgi:aryl-alcohol dehydrogenase-like predicted oxidoreductase
MHEAHPEILLMPYSSAANGFFHRLLKEGEEAVFKASYYSPENLLIAEKLRELCAGKQCTLTQAMLSWFTVQDVRCLPLYATHQPERVKEALKTAEFHFEPEDFAFAQLKY